MIYELVLRNFDCSPEFVFSLLLLQPFNFSPVRKRGISDYYGRKNAGRRTARVRVVVFNDGGRSLLFSSYNGWS